VSAWPSARLAPDPRVAAAVAELDRIAAELAGRPDPAGWVSRVEYWRASILAAGTVDALDEIRLDVARKIVEPWPG
jgi:hypothetical protein